MHLCHQLLKKKACSEWYEPESVDSSGAGEKGDIHSISVFQAPAILAMPLGVYCYAYSFVCVCWTIVDRGSLLCWCISFVSRLTFVSSPSRSVLVLCVLEDTLASSYRIC